MKTTPLRLALLTSVSCCALAVSAQAEDWPTLDEYVKKCVLIVKCRTDDANLGKYKVLETWKGPYSPDLFHEQPPDGFLLADSAHGNADSVAGREVIFFYTRQNQPESGKLQSHSTAFPINNGKIVYASTSESLRKEYSVNDFRAAVMTIFARQSLIDAGMPAEQVARFNDIELFERLLKLRTPTPPWQKWTYAELSKQADTVVIAKFVSSVEFAFDAGKFPAEAKNDLFRAHTSADSTIGVTSKFDVLATIRGQAIGEQLEVVHLKHGPNVVNLSDVRLAVFEKEIRIPTMISLVIEGEPRSVSPGIDRVSIVPEYLLFLKRRDDGRYEAASGQLHSEYSVRILNRAW